MERLLFECAVRAMLVATGTAVALRAMRISNVAVRHHAWKGVLLSMLLLPLWTARGPKLLVHVLPPQQQQATVSGLTPNQDSSIVLAQTNGGTAGGGRFQGLNWGQVAIGIYVLGAAALLLRLFAGTLGASLLVRQAHYRNGQLTHASCASPITVGCLRPATILPESWPEWPQAKLDAVLTHEGEHARRHDPLVQWLALLNRAVFWFHPLAWWLERRLSALSEAACDMVVLERGHSPREYSEYLLDLARSVSAANGRLKVLGMPMPGLFLPQRIHRILQGGTRLPRISRFRITCTIAVCALLSIVASAATLARARIVSSSPVRQTARLSGNVYDAKGTPLANAVITLARTDGATQWMTTASRGNGTFDFSGLPVGHYMVHIVRPGFASLHIDDLRVEAVQRVPLNIMLPAEAGSFPAASQAKVGGPRGTAGLTSGYVLREITITGAQAVSEGEVLSALGLTPGQLFDNSRLRKGFESLKDVYGSRGYVNFVPDPVLDVDEQHRTLTLRINIDEGRPFVVNRITIAGNTRTPDELIWREILVKEGQVFNSGLWDLSVLRLKQLGYFAEVETHASITPSVAEAKLDIILEVREK